jgi:hypothetical protein
MILAVDGLNFRGLVQIFKVPDTAAFKPERLVVFISDNGLGRGKPQVNINDRETASFGYLSKDGRINQMNGTECDFQLIPSLTDYFAFTADIVMPAA